MLSKTVIQWAEFCLTRDAQSVLRAKETYRRFSDWCASEGVPTMKEQAFYNVASAALKASGGARGRDREGVFYVGIKIAPRGCVCNQTRYAIGSNMSGNPSI